MVFLGKQAEEGKWMPLRFWRHGMPAFDKNLSILWRTFSMMIVKLNILEGCKYRVKTSILNSAEKYQGEMHREFQGYLR